MKERMIRLTAVIVGAIVVILILIHAWKVFSEPSERNGKGEIETEAADDIWVDVVELGSNDDITVSLKEAVLGVAGQQKKLVVFEQKVSDIIKVTDEGKLPFGLSEKYQYVKYSGTASYTVDLAGVNENSLKISQEDKTITIFIPHAVVELNINEEKTQTDETEKVGIFSIGDLKLSEEERSEVIAEVKSNMAQKLEEDNIMDIADRMARLSVWEIYQPVVTKVSPEYIVVTEFIEGE